MNRNICVEEMLKVSVLTEEDHIVSEKMSKLYKVLSEPKRVKIVLALSKGELCVHQLIKLVGAEQSLVSHQLKILRDANLVKTEKRGNEVVYSLSDRHVFELLKVAKDHVCEGGL